MRKTALILALLALPQAALAQSLTADEVKAIDSAVSAELARTGVPSAQIAVMRGGELVLDRAWGKASETIPQARSDLPYQIASNSKQFLAALLLMLEDDGKLSLDDKVAKWLPQVSGADKITLRMLLTHTSGLQDFWPQDYSFADMADDAIAILDGYGIDKAHIVGMSMGGMLAQQVALRYPDRVRTATFISTSPLGVKNMPPSTEAYRAYSAEGEKVDWTDLEAMAAYISKDCAMIASTRHPHDAEAVAALIERDMKRARDFRSVTNHFMLLGDDGGSELKAADIKVPVLVIHGTSDPLFPVEHGEAFAGVVPGARLVRIDGGGHEIHQGDIQEIVAAITRHARA